MLLNNHIVKATQIKFFFSLSQKHIHGIFDHGSQEPALVPASHPEALLRAVPTPWNVDQDVASGLEGRSPKVCS